MGADIWNTVCDELAQSIGPADFRNWIDKTRFGRIDGGVAVLEVPTRFVGEWVEKTYGDRILKIFRRIDPKVIRLQYLVDTAERSNTGNADNSSRHAAAREDRISSTNLIPRLTFDEFVVGKPNSEAHAAARHFADDGATSFNPLFLHGGVGLGKTHLMNAVGWEMLARNPDLKLIYLSAEQFAVRFIRALRERSIFEFKEMFRSVDVLMIDDIQFIAGKDSTTDEFFHTFNALYDGCKKIVLSGDRPPARMERLGSRFCSRLQSGLRVELKETDYELRLGILRRKLQFHMKSMPDLSVSEGVLELIARRVASNVRVLEGALNRLVASQSFSARTRITMEDALDVLSDHFQTSSKKVQIAEIIKTTATRFNIDAKDMVGTRRTHDITRPRQVAMYLAKELTQRSLADIGREFNRDHTTAIYSVGRIEKLKLTDDRLVEDIDAIRRDLKRF